MNYFNTPNEAYDRFLEQFPLDSLPSLTLEKYSHLRKYDNQYGGSSFCYWLKFNTLLFGNFSDIDFKKFGIYAYKKMPEEPNYELDYDDEYAWLKTYNKKTARDAYKVILKKVCEIAQKASSEDFIGIEAIDEIDSEIKWKIAFCYSNKKIVPIFDEEKLREIVFTIYDVSLEDSSISSIQKFLFEKKGSLDVFSFRDLLIKYYTLKIESNENLSTQVLAFLNLSQKYTKADFLKEVFINNEDLEVLERLILTKKNIILQGAPGVGKTYTANRLAWLLLGERKDENIGWVQFHQNYSYEDFVMGYKPSENNTFILTKGIFYKFCEKAKLSPNEKFFFIIDEINRGNLSKIFGELLVLIEKDYRDKKITLVYQQDGDSFCVPQNVYIIGLMNTADRSLALIDYALRRRFSFYEMSPGFDSIGFKNYLESREKEERQLLKSVIEKIKEINKEINADDSLGAGFEIGHSYFYTQQEIDKDWLSDVINFDILPMLKEYWFDNRQKFDDIKNKIFEDPEISKWVKIKQF